MKKKTKIALVQYLNTLPFQQTFLRVSNLLDLEVILAPPSECAELLKRGAVDLSLVPLGAINEIKEPKIVTDFGIACDGAVRTVCAFSNIPIEKINHLYLDNHSRTSRKLMLILLRDYWGLDPSVEITNVADINSLAEDEGVLMIGDKVFDNENKFNYKYDLGLEWKNATGLPFLFAAWVYSDVRPVEEKLIEVLNNEFENEVSHIENNPEETLIKSGYDKNFVSYFKNNIDYRITKATRMAIKLFQEKSTNYSVEESNLV